MTPDFRRINFGFTSAEKESARAPELLLDGYVDLHQITEKALTGDEFLFLGYKGSGKSALGQRLHLIHKDDPTVFINNVSLADFQYSILSSIVKEEAGNETRYPTGWAWIICVYCFISLSRDASAFSSDPTELPNIFGELRALGLLGDSSFSRIIETVKDRNWKFGIPGIFEYGSDPSSDAHFQIISKTLTSLKEALRRTATSSRHYIIIDGLDDVLSGSKEQYKSLSALIYEVDRFNDFLYERAPYIKVILVCRTDVFEVIGGSNRNKVRQDSGKEISWFSDARNPQLSKLVAIANMRASLALGRSTDVFNEFFPEKVLKRPTIRVLLDMTRHVPRDFLQLLTFIKESCIGPKPDGNAVLNGMRRYSIEYFLPEIYDEMEGYCEPSQFRELIILIGTLRSRDFYVKSIIEAIHKEKSSLSNDTLHVMLHALFECSAIGNVNEIEYWSRGKRLKKKMITYRYRNRHVSFNKESRIILHRGLWKAFNLPDTEDIFDFVAS